MWIISHILSYFTISFSRSLIYASVWDKMPVKFYTINLPAVDNPVSSEIDTLADIQIMKESAALGTPRKWRLMEL